MSSKLSIRGLQKSFVVNEGFGRSRTIHTIERVDLDLREGEFVCVIEKSGPVTPYSFLRAHAT
ncbi:MAG: hypothetical protein ACE5JU_11220 [Candidatus Binatia bacterium]